MVAVTADSAEDWDINLKDREVLTSTDTGLY